MVDRYIRDIVVSIAEQERDRASVDWSNIELEALAAISYINENSVEVDNRIYHFLEDIDARRKSPLYAQHQIEDVLALVN